jgi:hypothetical protein
MDWYASTAAASCRPWYSPARISSIPSVRGERSRGLVRAQQAGDVDRGDVLTGQGLGDGAGLLVAERGEPGPGIGGIEDPLDVAGGLTVAEEEKSHAPHRTRSAPRAQDRPRRGRRAGGSVGAWPAAP